MKGIERRRELLEWLEERGHLTLAEIVARFGVSKMTVHRDLEVLEKRRLLKRIHGGVIAGEAGKGEAPILPATTPLPGGGCLICQRSIPPHLLYTLTTSSGVQQRFCCAHCGISAQLASAGKVRMAMATDFLSGRPHPAQQSWFVLGSVVLPCCRPSLLTFEDEEMARRFQNGFGGRISNMEGALDYLRGEMSLHRDEPDCPHCAAISSKGY